MSLAVGETHGPEFLHLVTALLGHRKPLRRHRVSAPDSGGVFLGAALLRDPLYLPSHKTSKNDQDHTSCSVDNQSDCHMLCIA
jgi:hypothetical protein